MIIDHAWMEYNALGYSGTNSGGSSSSSTPSSTTTRTASTPTPRSTATPRPRRTAPAPARRHQPDHPHPLVLGVHAQLRPQQQQHQRARGGQRRRRPDRHGHDHLGGHQRHRDGQHLRQQRGVGDPVRAVPRQRARRWTARPAPGPAAWRTPASAASSTPRVTPCSTTPSSTTGTSGTRPTRTSARSPSTAASRRTASSGNIAPQGSAPAEPREVQPTCGPLTKAANTGGPLLDQVLCDTGFGTCPSGAHYPQPTGVVHDPLPKVATMPNPCAGVPANAWCTGGGPPDRRCRARSSRPDSRAHRSQEALAGGIPWPAQVDSGRGARSGVRCLWVAGNPCIPLLTGPPI